MAVPENALTIENLGLNPDHGVQFYYNDQVLAEAVAQFVGNGLLAIQPVMVIATAAHRELITDVLLSQAFDVSRAEAFGQLRWLDAHQTLVTFMDGAVPNTARFNKYIGGTVAELRAGRKGIVVRAFGEMVDILWRAGLAQSALRLEELWNGLAQRYSFSLLCAYGLGNFHKETKGSQYRSVCDLHQHVMAAEHPDLMTDERHRAREAQFLRQRARALTHEFKQCEALQQDLRTKLSE